MSRSIDDATPEEWDAAVRAADIATDMLNYAAYGDLGRLNDRLNGPFGEVELSDRCLAFALWQQGHPVERSTPEIDEWHECLPQWVRSVRYRLLPRPIPLVLPSIDWSHVDTHFGWLAQDQGGQSYLFEFEPEHGNDYPGWGRRGKNLAGDMVVAKYFASFRPGSGDWKKLIVERPA
ncbi:hypothetical protein NDK50_08050 [Paraburkholderia bryophila]|uniref:hypothetical protein n=1 Tax=Paraburkholderia bryophila TaxID=420952 RepID=UPI002348FF6D|nr:hypothetical protein [Paraburkholderia bryophila]WCM21388.1 hypothetical protein NDK50_08050 [Paraburkholderia bryophila]